MPSAEGAFAKGRRLLGFLYLQRVKGFPPPGDEPFMDPEGIERFHRHLAKATRYLEYGSGGTTVLASRNGVTTVSVENDRFYARAVASRLEGDAVRQLVVDTGPTREWGFPLFPSPEKARAYVSAPWAEGGACPDFILVDGRYRRACALESARQVHKRGAEAVLMFDDYSVRPQYEGVETYLGQPEMAGRTALFAVGQRDIPSSAVEGCLSDSW